MKALFVKTLTTAGAVVALAAATLPAAAQAGETYNRVHRQEQRLNQGVASGQLTRGEYRRVDHRLDSINAQRRADLRANGGHLTPAEEAKLNRELNRSSDNIYFDKHNRKDQPGV